MFTFQQQNHPTISNVRLELVVESLAKIHHLHRSFFTLSREQDGSYVQCAGSKKRLTIEARTYSSKTVFTHIVFGRGETSKTKVLIACDCGPLSVFAHEVLTLEDAILVFTAFFQGQEFPSGYVQRDCTADFLKASTDKQVLKSKANN